MANIIPVPIRVSIGISAAGAVKNFGSFEIVPYVTNRGGSMEIASWFRYTSSGEAEALSDVPLFSLLPRKLLWHICRYTFESDERESMPLVLTIDDESWSFPMCAKELEYEEVHYLVDVEGEWMRIGELALSDVMTDDNLIWAEREARVHIDFGDEAAIFDEMN